MKLYRAYFLSEEGKIFHGENVEASDHEAAIAAGWRLLMSHNATEDTSAHGLEIWDGGEIIFKAGPDR